MWAGTRTYRSDSSWLRDDNLHTRSPAFLLRVFENVLRDLGSFPTTEGREGGREGGRVSFEQDLNPFFPSLPPSLPPCLTPSLHTPAPRDLFLEDLKNELLLRRQGA